MDKNREDILFHQDSIHCRQILPIETWKLITKRLKKDPNALENLSNSSPFFRQFLAYQRSSFLLKKTLAVVIPHIWNNEDEEVLPVQEFLKCRQLNSSWNHLVDNSFVENFKKSEDTDSKLLISPKIQSTVRYNFSSLYTPTKLVNFINHFQLTHHGQLRSPFICPELSIHVHTISTRINEPEQQFFDGISALLQKYGLHVRKFNIDIQGATFVTRSNVLQCWFRKMGNLKGLKLECDEMVREARHLPSLKIPTFNQLEYLETSKLPGALFNKLIHRNNHVLSLKVRTWEENYTFLHFLNTQLEFRTFPNLKSLEMFIEWQNAFNCLASPLVQFPVLSQLTLWFSSSNGKILPVLNINWSEIFQMIQNKFAQSLEKLFLELPSASIKVMNVQNYKDSLMFRLHLPKLKEVSLVLWKHTSLDFLLPMKDTLEIINLNLMYSDDEDEVKMTMYSIVQLRGYENKIWASNIPYLFTKVRKIGIRRKGDWETKWYSRNWIERMRSN